MTTATDLGGQQGLNDGDVDTSTGHAPAPAYSSYQGFKSMLDQLRDEGVPTVFDRSYFGSKSGGLIAQIRGTLRFLGLIDTEFKPTAQLHLLVEADSGQRAVMMRELMEQHYSEELALSKRRGTYGQLAALFKERRLNGATASKAATFLVHAMNDLGYEVSPYFTQGRPSSTGTSSSRARKRKAATPALETMPSPTATALAPPSQETQRSRYVEMLMKLAEASAEKGGEPSPELLDRIEKALGYQEQEVAQE